MLDYFVEHADLIQILFLSILHTISTHYKILTMQGTIFAMLSGCCYYGENGLFHHNGEAAAVTKA